MKKILLLDIENSHKTEHELKQYLMQYEFVYLVYAKSPMCISLDGLVELAPFVINEKLKIFKMPKMGKDSADFGLTFIAGQLSTQVKADEYCFDIMSNDKKFEYIVDLLTNLNFQAEQIKREVPPNKVLKSETVMTKLPKKDQEQLSKVIALLKKNSPKKVAGLNNCLRSWQKMTAPEVNVQIELLKKYQVIRIENETVQYNLNQLDLVLSGQVTQKHSTKIMQEHAKQRSKQVNTVQTVAKSTNTQKRSAPKLLSQMPAIYEIVQRPLLQKIKSYCDYLSKTKSSRPGTMKSLQNSVKALFRFEHQIQLKEMMNLMKQYQILSCDTKLVYHNEVIQAWVNLDLNAQIKEDSVAA